MKWFKDLPKLLPTIKWWAEGPTKNTEDPEKWSAWEKVMEIHEDNDGYGIFANHDSCPICHSTFERDMDGEIVDTSGGGPY